MASGFSVDDPATFVEMLDWDQIPDHWDFWPTPGFPPVMATRSKLFQPGRPLVRHYDFGADGMLDDPFPVAKVMIGDDGEQGNTEGKPPALANVTTRAKQAREAYAVDMGDMTWWCSLLGDEREADARADPIRPGDPAASHILTLTDP